MKIALVQTNPLIGDIEGNARKIVQAIRKAREMKADLVCFPELSVVGYPPRDLLEIPSVLARCQQAIQVIARACEGIACLVGSPEPNESLIGKPLFNTAFWCEEGKSRARFRKSLLPTYDVFDESRYFEPGRENEPIEFQGQRFGVTVCEDIWNDADLFQRQLYPSDPVQSLIRKRCDVLLNISASPFAAGKFDFRRKIISNLASQSRAKTIYVNQVGGNDELVFDGGSMVMDANGDLIALAPFFKEGLTLVDLDRPSKGPHPVPAGMVLLEEALVTGLRDYVRKCGFKKVALGLSGGIDSALVAYLATKALGPKNVLGLMMPSRYSSRGSLADSRALARNLKIPTQTIPIDLIHRSYEASFRKLFGKTKSDTTEENVQARIRGNLLMAVSNKLGHLVLSTGNKSELAVGYCTLYGDMSGGLAVISDVPKTTVYELCHHINRRREIIPESIFTKPPSAELRPDQTDQDSLPPYEVLDPIIKAAIEDLKSEDEIVALGFDRPTVRRILTMIARNEYKRRQAVPGLKVTSKAFGMGRRFPIACKF